MRVSEERHRPLGVSLGWGCRGRSRQLLPPSCCPLSDSAVNFSCSFFQPNPLATKNSSTQSFFFVPPTNRVREGFNTKNVSKNILDPQGRLVFPKVDELFSGKCDFHFEVRESLNHTPESRTLVSKVIHPKRCSVNCGGPRKSCNRCNSATRLLQLESQRQSIATTSQPLRPQLQQWLQGRHLLYLIHRSRSNLICLTMWVVVFT